MSRQSTRLRSLLPQRAGLALALFAPTILPACDEAAPAAAAPNDALAVEGEGGTPDDVPAAQLHEAPAEPTDDPPADTQPEPASTPTTAGRSMPAGDGTQGHGESCHATQRCGPNLGCSGLFYEAAGTCIAEAKAQSQCEAQGSEWGKWGMAGYRYCMPVHPDAGKTCQDGGECTGDCILQEDGNGKCQKYKTQFGCFTRLKDGQSGGTLCVD